MIFDTHAHYLDARFDEDRQDVILSLHDNNVACAVEVSAGVDDFYDIISLTEKYPFMYGTIGVHPSEVDKLSDEWLHKMEKLAANDKIVAIGEIGLDYHFDDDPEPTVQKMWFKKQIELARKVNLPLIIHSRDSAKDTLDILKETDAGKTGGVIHCFSYSKEIALECVDMGFYIGLDGPVTFKNGKKAKEVAKAVPIERLVVETDSPYMAPDPIRGTRNFSGNLKYIISEIASLRDIPYDDMEKILFDNARALYRLEDKCLN